ncbi:Fe-S-cluster oxidoreductase [Duganella sp. 1224]|uniref:Fe-S-cluster oxidoreductase n=1 Tax=Duganella sp. 1224 TaxID=2587052 RepID=UPI0035A6B2A8
MKSRPRFDGPLFRCPRTPRAKPAGVRCAQPADDNRCLIFGRPERPAFCAGLQPAADMCGASREHAVRWLGDLERATAPGAA